ncbi:hypothetical protein MIMGU_mgv1a024838mg [Erythranthe guttata]|uniref:RING-type E3 ubiquitin transferase n=1 Tax=Erythranthe guttata TaxID=4155 RepID=A0A022RLI9_ERYGU|nr:hypothetical protein MIMGU_mgv1a024838mg [Erythranthe guttata]
MWLASGKSNNSNAARRNGRNGLVAVAIDKDKGSQAALKWATENLLTRGQTVILIHVVQRSSLASFGYNFALQDLNGATCGHKQVHEKQTKELLLTFHCFCSRKDINCFDVVLEDTDVAKAITEYVAHAAIENLVLGASRHGFIRRLKTVDIPMSVSKTAPDFCTVYVISKTKISSVKNASRLAQFVSPLKAQIHQMEQGNGAEKILLKESVDDIDIVKSPFSRGSRYNGKPYGDFSEPDTDISFISSDRPSVDKLMSTSSDSSYGSIRSGARGSEQNSFTDFSSSSLESDDVEAEMRRLKLELQRTMEMYSTACKAALTAQQKAVELHRWRMDEERRLEEARLSEESAKLTAEQEKAKCRAAMENAEAAQRIAEIESQKRASAEMKALQESDEKDKAMSMSQLRYRRYCIEEIEEATEYFAEARKVGEGGYGPVYKCYLDHTPVAVKVLRPDAAQGRSQFHKEVEVLSCMRHPNMVLLLGACPEYGCLVYEYMAKGSLEDRLFRRGNTGALSWPLRFRIAAEIATGLHFLHQTKPEPLVHRDLKPGNILLDQNYVSKISDVGLARLVPPSVADDVTQYRMTSAAGTFCYIDPEYQQTGMLGVKSDVYSFGVVLLQIITAKQAMGLTHHISRSIEKGTFAEMLDPAVPDWPVEEALVFAKLALQCAELRRKDRPDLGRVVLPELNRLRDFGDENMNQFLAAKSDPHASSKHSDLKDYASSASLPDNLSGIIKNNLQKT